MDNEQGQSLVELGLSFTILVFLLSGVVEFGTMFFQFVQLRDAVQEGALYGSTHPNDYADIENRTRGASNTPINLESDSVSIVITATGLDGTVKSGGVCEGDALEVRAIYPHKIFMPFLPLLIGRDTIHLNAHVVDTVLYPVC